MDPQSIPEITFPGEGDEELVFAPEVRPEQTSLNKAYELFLQSDLDTTDIALELGISSKVVASWARKGKWLERRRAIEDEEMKVADAKYRAVVREHRVPTVLRHLEVSAKLETGIGTVLDAELAKELPDSRELERMSRALAASTGVSARAAGITEKPHEDTLQTQGRVPLILLNVVPVPATVDKKAIDISGDVTAL